jgi:hypothetical protein
MLKLIVGKDDLYDEATGEFRSSEPIVLELEHSLVSLSRWESKWEQPFLGRQEKTSEQSVDYVRCMALDGELSTGVFALLSDDHITAISEYIEKPMTATTINDKKQRGGETITSELIYYWMIQLNIPFEAQHWHLNRLLTLVRVCNFKNAPKKKMSAAEIASQRRALNDERRARFNTSG